MINMGDLLVELYGMQGIDAPPSCVLGGVVWGKCRDADVYAVRSRTGEVYLETVDHIGPDYYRDKGVATSDMTAVDDERRAAVCRHMETPALDFGCGGGGFGQILWNEYNKPSWGYDPAKQDEATRLQRHNWQTVTMFHVIEHLTDPIATLREIHDNMAPGGTLIVETPYARDFLYSVPAACAHLLFSEHLLVHTRQSLRRLLEHCGFEVRSITGLQRYGLANHLHWLATGKPGGHRSAAHLSNPELDRAYAGQLASRDENDTLWCVAVKR